MHLGSIERDNKLAVPGSITQCKKVFWACIDSQYAHSFLFRSSKQKSHVNLVDLIDSRRRHTKVRVFRTKAELISYMRATRNFFPKETAKE